MKSVATVFTVALVLAMSAGAFAQHKLEYKATGLTPIHYRAHTEISIIEGVMGQKAKVSTKTDQKVSVKSRQMGGELICDITVDSSGSETVLPSGDTTRTMSSAADGQTEETRMRPDGRPISTRWLDTTFAKTQLGHMKSFENLFFRLPDKEVESGTTWNESIVDTVGGKGNIYVTKNSSYKVAGEETLEGVPCVKIVFSGTLLVKGATSSQGMDFSVNGTGTAEGTVFFDYTNGRIARMSGTTDQKLNMVSSGQQKMTIPMTQKTTYDLFLVK